VLLAGTALVASVAASTLAAVPAKATGSGAESAGTFDPKAASGDCPTAGVTCTFTQPSLPASLTLAGSSSYYAEQTLDGVLADEYGVGSGADTSLFTSTSAYQASMTSTSPVLASALGNLGQGVGGTAGAAGDDAVVLHADGTLELFGDQGAGYPLITSTTVPGPASALISVVVAAQPAGEGGASAVIVVTTGGFYDYNSTGSQLALANPSGPAALPVSGRTGPAGDPAFTSSGTGQNYQVPAGDTVLAAYEPPPNSATTANGAVSSFAIAYGGSGTFYVDIFQLSGTIQPIDHIEGPFRNGSVSPLTLSFAIDPGFDGHAGNNQDFVAVWEQGFTQSYSHRFPTTFDYGTDSPDVTTGIGDDDTACSSASPAVLPSLAVDTFIPGGVPASASGSFSAQVCAWRTNATTVEYQTKFFSLGADNTIESGSESPTPQTYTGGSQPVGAAYNPALAPVVASVSFPCAEVLGPVAKNSSPDSVDLPAGGIDDFCSDGIAGAGGDDAYAPLHPTYAVHFTGVECSDCHAGSPTYLVEHDATYQWGTGNVPNSTFSSTYTALPQVTVGTTPAFAMLPLDPTPTTWAAHLLVNGRGTPVQAPATSNPIPTAVMIAPPYYNGGQQQVSPTTTTIVNSSCSGASTSYSNSVGLSGGLDADFGPLDVEVEAIVGLDASFSNENEINNCNEIDQSFIDSNFGNDFVADNSLIFRVDTGTDTYVDLTSNSLGVGITNSCSVDDTGACNPIFVPSGSEYVLQSMSQIQNPQPNNVFAADDNYLDANYGAALAGDFPDPGNPASYAGENGDGTYPGCPSTSVPMGIGSGVPALQPNAFTAPESSAPDILAGPVAEVSPASQGNEGGTSSELTFNSETTDTSSTEITASVELSLKLGDYRGTATYEHGAGASSSASFESGTQFSGGVFDYTGFYNPYSYNLYECATQLTSSNATFGDLANTHASAPVFLVSYAVNQTPDGLPLNFVAPNNPSGTVGQVYSGQVFASGGTPNYSYAVTGGSLPPGVTLNGGNGQLSGTPTLAGSDTFTVRATDAEGNQASQSVTITINPVLSMPNTLPTDDVGTPYNQSLDVSGGVAPYTYLLASGSLPPGLGIDNSAGAITGTPTATGTYCFTVYVGDSNFPQADGTFPACITINNVLNQLHLTTSSATAEVGVPFSLTLKGASGGTTPYTWSTDALNPLPAGVSLNATTGVISGTFQAPGRYQDSIIEHNIIGDYPDITVTDATGASSSDSLTIVILPQLTLPAQELPDGETGSAYSQSVSASGGDGTYTYATAAATGSLSDIPPGLALSPSTGAITGTPTNGDIGTYSFSVSVHDGSGGTATQTFSIAIGDGATATAPIITSADAAMFTADVANTFTVTTAGSPTPELTVSGGLPNGVTFTDNHDGTATLAGAPNLLAAGSHSFVITAANGVDPAADQSFTMLIGLPPAITTQPDSQTVAAGTDTGFTSAATGTPTPTVLWQVSVDGANWSTVSGATSPTLSLPAVPASLNGLQYRAVYTNTLGTTTSNAATLTVTSPPIITTQPTDQTAVAGDDTTFSAAAAGNPAPTVQWLVSLDNGTEWSPISGATSPTLTLHDVPTKDDDNLYEAVFTNGSGTATTNVAALIVQSAPVVSLQPTNQSATAFSSVQFTANALGNPAPNVVWEVSSNGGAFTQLTSDTSPVLTLTATASMNGNVYRAFFFNSVGTATSSTAMVTVTQVEPTVTWTAPSAETYGAALGVGQLDAHSSVAGTFTYFPPAGTVLDAGNGQQLTVVFSPTDSTDYAPATQVATIDVHKAPLTITASSTSSTAGDPIPPVTPSYAGLVAGDSSSTALTTVPTCSSVATSSSAPGSYATTCTGAVSTNYAITYVPGTSVVSPASSSGSNTGSPPTGHGYWLVGTDGGIFTFGAAQFYGSTGSLALNRPVVGITPTADRRGYWLVASDGGIFSFGDTQFYGSIPGLGLSPAGTPGPHALNAPIVGAVPSADGLGYFMVGSDGGVFAFGDAKFEGSCPALVGGCVGVAVAVAPDASGNGYWLVTNVGHVYAFGDAANLGSPGQQDAAITALSRTPDGKGYWILDANGRVFAYGDAASLGSVPNGGAGGLEPAVAIVATSSGNGFWVSNALGKVFTFGDAPNDGDTSTLHLNGSIIAAAGF
jgi:hypothetical protein